jgi:hypothetical protein
METIRIFIFGIGVLSAIFGWKAYDDRKEKVGQLFVGIAVICFFLFLGSFGSSSPE